MERSRMARSLALLLVTSAVLLGPTSATAAMPHQLVEYGALVNCQFKVTESGKYGWTEAKFKHIVVKPPVMHSENGTKQTVGWGFVVVRSLDQESGPWKVTYRSPFQKRTATPSTRADFSKIAVDVAVPKVEMPRWVWYHVTLVMRWYNADGSVSDETDVAMSNLRAIVGGKYFDTESYCPAIEAVFIDGGP